MPFVRHPLPFIAGLLAGCLVLPLSGCALFNPAPAANSTNGAFAWLTNWVNQPIDAAADFDLETLRPEPRPAVVAPDDLLEVTVWDLYEPGKPYTFPVRVSERQTVEVPLINEIPVADRTLSQVEVGLVESLQSGEFLLHPKVLVRSLDPPTVKVQVSGAVARTGFMELPRNDASVYAALVSAGGLKRTAASQIAVVRHSYQSSPPSVEPTREREDPVGAISQTAALKSVHPEQHANSIEELSVDPGHLSPEKAVHSGDQPDAESRPSLETTATNHASTKPATAGRLTPFEIQQRDLLYRGPGSGEFMTWFDLDRADHRDALRSVRLAEGDEVIVKAVAPPVRIGGIVLHPGAYPLPAGRSLNVWQAIDMAGGLRARDVPLNITLVRPAAEGRPAQRKSLSVADYSRHPQESPSVEPGDVLHVEPTTGSKIKRAVGDLWNKP